MIPKLHTTSGLSSELGMDRRTIARRLAGVPPDGRVSGGHDAWLLRTAWPHLTAAERSPSGAADANAQRTRLVKAKADMAELRLAKERGELVSAKAATRNWSVIWVRVRDLLRSLPMSIVDQALAAAAGGRVELKNLLQSEIDDALRRAAALDIPLEDDWHDLDDNDEDESEERQNEPA